jgi:pyruvate kinase
LRTELLDTEGELPALDGHRRESARNFLHYLALRRHDISRLQDELSALGLSSLGRSEPCVLGTIESVLAVLERLAGHAPPIVPAAMTLDKGRALLEANTDALLGAPPRARRVRILVTMPSAAASDDEGEALLERLLERGMDLLRINCAHDDEIAWGKMIANLRRAERKTGRQCRVLMDLGGPKLRTGPLPQGPRVVKIKPKRDDLGRVMANARVWLTPSEAPESPPEPADVCLPVPHDWLARVEPGTAIRFLDARGAGRKLRVVARVGESRWAEAGKTSYVASDLSLHDAAGHTACVGVLPAKAITLRLHVGDTLVLTRIAEAAGCDGALRISCLLPELFDDVRAGEPIWLDDGKIGGVVKRVGVDEVEVTITAAPDHGAKLGSDKGINVPATELCVPFLSKKDEADLAFVARTADLVGLSFVRRPADVAELRGKLATLGGERLGIVLKIETRQAFEAMPGLIFAAMPAAAAGVMIARGDLAVECGYLRLAEVQEEILWLCEAAHMPVIWATQVLEKLATEGIPSRAEITDAAMGERAECVMLNKGPHILDAVGALDNILQRMERHQNKKRAMLRHLRLADRPDPRYITRTP